MEALSCGLRYHTCPPRWIGGRPRNLACPGQGTELFSPPIGKSRTPSAIGASRASTGNDGTDWNEEMNMFRKRMLKPNQLATLRQLEEEVDVGKVGFLGRKC